MAFLQRLLSNSRFHTFIVVITVSVLTWSIGEHLTLNGEAPLADPSHRFVVIGGLFLFWLICNVFLFKDQGPSKVYLNKSQRKIYKFLKEDLHQAIKNTRKNSSFLRREPKQPQWYIFFGLRHSGKTTLLNCVAKDQQGTLQRCSSDYIDYWHFNDAVFMNIKSYQTEDQSTDQDRIQVFNRLFYELNKCKVVPSGILITAQLQEIHTKSDLFDSEAGIIRHNIDYLTQLYPEIAISVVATKCDLILGFKEFFGHMGPEERDQVCGIQFPAPPYKISLPELCDQEFSAILNRFYQRVLWQISQEQDPRKRHLIKEFPVQLELLKPYMGHFLNQVLPHINLTLNGIYFTSANQAQAPLNHISKPIKEVFALQSISTVPSRIDSKTYFIAELFKQFIHAPRNEYIPNSYHWVNYASAIIALFSIACGGYLYNFYYEHDGNLQAVQKLLHYATTETNPNPYRNVLNQLYALQQTYNTLKSNTKTMTNQERTQNELLLKQAQASFWTVLQEQFFVELTNSVENELSRLTNSNDNNSLELFETLGTFLMIHDSNSFKEEQFCNWFDQLWAKQNISSTEQGLLNRYLHLLITRPLPQQKINFPLMLKAQTILKNKSPLTLSKDLFERSLAQHPVQLVEQNADLVIDANFNMISNIFMRDHIAIVQQRAFDIAREISKHLWTIDADSIDEQTLVAELLEDYYINYANHWQHIISKVRYRPHQQFNLYAADLTILNADHSALKELIHKIQDNTKPIAGNDQFNQLVSHSFVNINSIDIDSYNLPFNKALGDLSDSMNAINRANNPIATAYAHARLRLTHQSHKDALSQMYATAKFLPEPLQKWSNDLADEGWTMVLNGARAYLNAIWQQFVLPEYRQTIANRYPVFKDSRTDINFDDLSRFFAAHGIMETFYNNYLSDFVDEERGWHWKSANGRNIGISDNTLEQFMRALLIQKMLFNHSSTPAISFTMKQTALSPSIKEFSLLIDNQTVEYQDKAESQTTITWPGSGTTENQMCFINNDGKSTKLTFDDAWGWFRVMDLAKITGSSNTQKITAAFKFAGVTVAQFEILSDSVINPFTPDVISKFRCPDVL